MSNLLGLEEKRPSSGEYDNVELGPDPDAIARAKRGASWFYWIAALSMINSAAFLVGANFHFLAGLGFTEIADAIVESSIQQGAPVAFKAIAVIFDLIVVTSFALAGYFSNKLVGSVFLLGIIVYVIDAIIVLLLGDFLMAGFHAFALYSLIRGYLACREIQAYRKSNVSQAPQPPAPTTFA